MQNLLTLFKKFWPFLAALALVLALIGGAYYLGGHPWSNPAPPPPPLALKADYPSDGGGVVLTATAQTPVFWDLCPTLASHPIDASSVLVWPKTGTKAARHAVTAATYAGGKVVFAHTMVSVGPPPDPPAPPGPPTPPTPPAPIPVAGLRVLIVYDAAVTLPAAQQPILYGAAFRASLNQQCVVGADGQTKEWRIWDKGTNVSSEAKLWQDALARPRASVPWLIVSNGKSGFEGPLPADLATATTLVQKYAVGG